MKIRTIDEAAAAIRAVVETQVTVVPRENVLDLQGAAEALLRAKTRTSFESTGKAPPVYVASNGLTTEDTGKLEGMIADLGSPKIHSVMLSPEDIPAQHAGDLNFISHVEMAICVKATKFIKSPGSTWSYNVNALRGNGVEEGMRSSAQLLAKRAMMMAANGTHV